MRYINPAMFANTFLRLRTDLLWGQQEWGGGEDSGGLQWKRGTLGHTISKPEVAQASD